MFTVKKNSLHDDEKQIKNFKIQIFKKACEKSSINSPGLIYHPVIANIATSKDIKNLKKKGYFDNKRNIFNFKNTDVIKDLISGSLGRQNGQNEEERSISPELKELEHETNFFDEKIKHAINYLKLSWPEIHDEFNSLVTHVVWCSSLDHISSTEAGAFGVVFVSPKKNWPRCMYYETLVHESAHLRLMITESFSKLLLNPNKLSTSPLRLDPRPMRGILHAVFVLSRIVEAYVRLKPHLTNNDELLFLNEQIKVYSKSLQSGISTLEREAEFTPDGHQLLKEIQSSNAGLNINI